MLCSNRPEGFGPKSQLSSPIPTSCFVDTILIPLPIWLALAALPILFLLSLHHRKQNYDPSTAHLRARPAKSWVFRIVSGIYYILIICNILMQVLEIVRLELIRFGIGLLPFTFVGLLLGGLLHLTEGFKGRIRGWLSINSIIWIGGIAVTVVKVVGLSKEGIDARKGSKYPMSDQITDVAVIAGVYAVVMVLEVVLAFWRALRQAKRRDSTGSGGAEMIGQAEGYANKYDSHIGAAL